MDGEPVGSPVRVGRGIVHAQANGQTQIVLVNLQKTPISVRAGQVIAYARCVQESDYQVVECELEGETVSPAQDIDAPVMVAALNAQEGEVVRPTNPFFTMESPPGGGGVTEAERVAAEGVRPSHKDDSVATDAEVQAEIAKLPEGVSSLIRDAQRRTFLRPM